MPPHVWHVPLPWHAEHGDSYLNAFKVPGISSAGIFPFPWHTGQFPSPGESQSGQVWVAILHLPTVLAILIWLHTTVKELAAVLLDELCDLILVVQIPQGFEFRSRADTSFQKEAARAALGDCGLAVRTLCSRGCRMHRARFAAFVGRPWTQGTYSNTSGCCSQSSTSYQLAGPRPILPCWERGFRRGIWLIKRTPTLMRSYTSGCIEATLASCGRLRTH